MKVLRSGIYHCIFLLVIIAALTLHAALSAEEMPGEDIFSVTGTGNFDSFGNKERQILLASSDDNSFLLPETSSQHILKKRSGSNRTELTLETGNNRTYKSPVKKEDLSSSRFINLSGSDITDIAAALDGGTTDEIIRKSREFVYTFISNKIPGTPLINSNQIIKSRSGDCKQHTVLLIAILRKLNIPARALTGVVFQKEYAGRENRFVYHMWAEVFDGKKWTICDPSFPAGRLKSSDYIAISYHSLKSEIPQAYGEAVQHIKNFKIAIKP